MRQRINRGIRFARAAVGPYATKIATKKYARATVLGKRELLKNGTFDTDTAGWAARAAATLSWEAQKAKVNVTGSGGGIQSDQTIPALTVGIQYRVQWDVIGITGGYAGNFGMFDSTGQINDTQEVTTVIDTPVRFDQTFTATQTSITIEINRRTASTGDVYFDNISLKQA